jgi:hypothetical protein
LYCDYGGKIKTAVLIFSVVRTSNLTVLDALLNYEYFLLDIVNKHRNKSIGYVFIPCHLIVLRGTPWSRVLPEKLKRPELLKKFPAFYGTRRFITTFTRARHLSLS